ncbi:hypothetical protein GCM10009646_89590 [Streptomyces aureus]
MLLWLMRVAYGLVVSVAGVAGGAVYDLASGGSVVVVLTGLFVLTWCLAPRHGLLASWSGVRRPRPWSRSAAESGSAAKAAHGVRTAPADFRPRGSWPSATVVRRRTSV